MVVPKEYKEDWQIEANLLTGGNLTSYLMIAANLLTDQRKRERSVTLDQPFDPFGEPPPKKED